jgi:hypothetical protein
MVRRLLCLGTILLLLLSFTACGEKDKPKAPAVKDPEGDFVPKPGGGKSG